MTERSARGGGVGLGDERLKEREVALGTEPELGGEREGARQGQGADNVTPAACALHTWSSACTRVARTYMRHEVANVCLASLASLLVASTPLLGTAVSVSQITGHLNGAQSCRGI